MKKIFTLLSVLMLTSLTASAQDIEGYANIYVRVQAATPATGRVSVTPPGGGLETYKETVDFQQTLPVSVNSVYFNVKARANDGYTFAGWYVDDGDGVFDIAKDYYDNEDLQTMLFVPLSLLGFDDDYEPYPTENDAKVGQKPTQPQMTIFALFTNGANVYVDYMQEDCGTVQISKPLNQAGDEVTVKAIPNEGYRFEYWKTGRGTQIDQKVRDTSVSRDAEWTFTVKGGEKYYAYFSSEDAPVLDFPEEGGWQALQFDKAWYLHEQADAMVYNAILGDIVTNDAGQSFFNQDDEDAWYDSSRQFHNAMRGYGNCATLIYGKGQVRFTHYIPGLGFDRANNILEWSGSKPYTIQDKGNAAGYHVYVFRPAVNAFVKLGTTDLYEDIQAPEQITVPANTCYLCLEGIQIADPVTDYIPTVIGMTPADYDRAVQGIADVPAAASAGSDAVYDLQGRRVPAVHRPGLYIRNGKKVTF